MGLRRTPLARVSKKRQAEGPEYERAVQGVFVRDHFVCQGARRGLAHDCYGRLDPHHIWAVGAGGPRCDPANMVVLCRTAHDLVHLHPVKSRALGLLA